MKTLAAALVDVPIRHSPSSNPPGRVAHSRTLARVLWGLCRLPSYDRVVLFCSPGAMSTWGLLVIATARVFRIPVALRFFGGAPLAPIDLATPVRRAITRRLFRTADRVVVQTEIARRKMEEFTGQAARKVAGYRESKPASTTDSRDNQGIRFVFTGRATPEKGIDVLLDAWKRLRASEPRAEAWTLEVCGATNPTWQSKIQATPGVTYHGSLEHHLVASILTGCRALVFPTRYSEEGHSGSIIEALFAGVPVITSTLSGPAELIRSGENGFLVDPLDVNALMDAITKLATDEDLFQELRQGSKKSSSQYDAAVAVPRLATELGLQGRDWAQGQ